MVFDWIWSQGVIIKYVESFSYKQYSDGFADNEKKARVMVDNAIAVFETEQFVSASKRVLLFLLQKLWVASGTIRVVTLFQSFSPKSGLFRVRYIILFFLGKVVGILIPWKMLYYVREACSKNQMRR